MYLCMHMGVVLKFQILRCLPCALASTLFIPWTHLGNDLTIDSNQKVLPAIYVNTTDRSHNNMYLHTMIVVKDKCYM